MDKIYNNESVICCTLLKILSYKTWNATSLSVLIPLLLEDKYFKILTSVVSIEDIDKVKILTFDKMYNSYLPLFSNAIVLLEQSCLIERVNDLEYSLTSKGQEAANALGDMHSHRVDYILSCIPKLLNVIETLSIKELFFKLKIVLRIFILSKLNCGLIEILSHRSIVLNQIKLTSLLVILQLANPLFYV